MLSHFLRAVPKSVAPSGIQYIGVSSAVQLIGASVVCSVPSGAQAGDLLIGVSTQTGTATAYTMTPPSGWTETFDANGRWAGYLSSWNGATSTYTFTKSNAAADPVVAILAFRNAVFDVQGAITATAANPATAPAITLTANNSVVVAAFSSLLSTQTYSQPTGYTEVIDTSYGLAVSYKTDVAAGSSGTVSSTGSDSNNRGFLIGIKPA